MKRRTAKELLERQPEYKSSMHGNKRHGMSRHPAYFVWRSMKCRCLLPTHHAWKNYGARGITVCDRWLESFENFWADMGETYQPGLELERVDNDAGYMPENCKWATRTAQGRNRRTNVFVETRDGKMLLVEAAEKSGIGKTTLHYRMRHGANPYSILSTPDVATDLSSRDEPDHW